MEELAVTAVALTVIAVPVWVLGRLAKRFLARREDRRIALEDRGSVHEFRMPLLLAIIIAGSGGVLLTAGLIPLAVFVATGDTEARRVALAMVPVAAAFVALATPFHVLGTRWWLVAPDALLLLSGRGDERRRVALNGATVTTVRSLTGAVAVTGADGARIRVPQQADGFDRLVDLLDRAGVRRPAQPHRAADPGRALEHGPVWRVSDLRLRGTMALLGVLLVVVLVWPWGVIEADNLVRDSLFFVLVGLFLWGTFALLIGQETFQRGQPIELRVAGDRLHLRYLRRPDEHRYLATLVSASVITDIIYVKGFPGYRHPLRLTFTDGTQLTIDDFRAKHYRTTTRELAADLRALCCTTATRTRAHHAAAQLHLAAAARAAEVEDHGTRAAKLDAAVAAWPSPDNLALHLDAADAWRRAGDLDRALASCAAHLDHAPGDARGWESLAAVHRARGRDDLASEAIATAERLHLT